MIKKEFINSSSDNLKLEVAYIIPKGEIKRVVQILHGMCEHKERYYDFMRFLADNKYAVFIHDHRGHGQSCSNLGDFNTTNYKYIIDDAKNVNDFIKQKLPNDKIYMFSHSMGTLVARGFIQENDNMLDKLILCGPPTKNELAPIALTIANFFNLIGMGNETNKFLDKLTFKTYNKRFPNNTWLSKNEENVINYKNDELCGFAFTTNGFINLYKLMINAFKKKQYHVNNPKLKIMLIAGSDDPVIQNEKKFIELQHFLHDVGYSRIESKLYKELRHELLNEKEKSVFQDILKFLDE